MYGELDDSCPPADCIKEVIAKQTAILLNDNELIDMHLTNVGPLVYCICVDRHGKSV